MEYQNSITNYRKDSFIIVSGNHKADSFYIIKEGNVSVKRSIMMEEEKSGILGPGDYFGVISAMCGRSHIETVRALTDVSLITIPQYKYGDFIKKNPQIGSKIIKEFSKRLRFLNKNMRKNTKVTPAVEIIGVKRAQGEAEAGELYRSYEKNIMIFAEGDPGDEAYIIQSGTVRITKKVENQDVLISTLKAGDVFGEMALIEDKPRDASAITNEKCRLMTVNKANFDIMIERQPQFISKITTLLAEWIWLVYKQNE